MTTTEHDPESAAAEAAVERLARHQRESGTILSGPALSDFIDQGSLRQGVFNDMTSEVREVNIAKGWRAADGTNDRSIGDDTALLHSEVSEAFEQYREIGLAERTRDDGKPDDFGSEMADILIRLLDTCDRRGVDLVREYERKIAYNRTRSFRHGGKRI